MNEPVDERLARGARSSPMSTVWYRERRNPKEYLPAMRSSRSAIIWSAVALIACAAVFAVVITNWHWYGSPDQIESHLLAETPLGSSEEAVLSYLSEKAESVKEPWRGPVTPNTLYPPNTVAGSSFITAVVGKYSVVFETSVEAFYIFDSDRRLVEIAVRKTTDGI